MTMTGETWRPAVLTGIALMLTGVFLFSCNDALGKYLLATYSVGQMLLIRSLAAMLLLGPFIWREQIGHDGGDQRDADACAQPLQATKHNQLIHALRGARQNGTQQKQQREDVKQSRRAPSQLFLRSERN